MQRPQPRIPMKEQPLKALDELGADPLEGSGFEDEKPEPESSDRISNSKSATG